MKTVFFTGKGDGGSSVLGKKEIKKDAPVFFMLGSLDQLNSWVGFTKTAVRRTSHTHDIRKILMKVQEYIFIAQAEVAFLFVPTKKNVRKVSVTTTHTTALEKYILLINEKLPPLRKFVLPGGSELAARLDVARTFARDAERYAVKLSRTKHIAPPLLMFLNRLSSLFFALARYANRASRTKEQHPSYR